MHESQLFPYLLASAIAAPVLARLAAWRLGTLVDARPGHTRARMPSLPVVPAEGPASRATDRAAGRFEAAVRQAERRAVQLLCEGATGPVTVEASELATKLAVHAEIATALLADWRARLPCRVRVTRSGRLLHDFAPETLKTAVRDGWHAWPQRFALWLAAVLANLGALWWVVVGIACGVVALRAVWHAETDEARLGMALLGIGEFAGVYLAAQCGGWMVGLLSATKGPKLAAKPENSAPRKLKISGPRKKGQPAPAAKSESQPKEKPSSGGFGWGDLVPSSIDLDVDGEGCIFVLALIAILVLLALIAGSLAVVVVWMIGLWRAVVRLGEPERHLNPALWVARAEMASPWERWLPTNDLAVRLVRALRRQLQGRPGDELLAGRVLARAKQQDGVVAAVDIALHEALDLREALDVGSRLVALHGGDLLVSDEGDVAFTFSAEALQAAADDPAPPQLEYLGDPANLAEPRKLPVNVVGLNLDHLGGAMRLAGGPWVTLPAMMFVVLGKASELPVRGLDLSMGLLFCLLSPGTFILAASALRTAKQSARVGLLRDVRRVTVGEVRRALDAGESWLLVDSVVSRVMQALVNLPNVFQSDDIRAEVEAMLVDLGLEPALTGKRGNSWDVAALAKRLKSLKHLRGQEGRPVAQGAGDEVVFDSAAA